MANGYILSKGAIQTFIKEVAGIYVETCDDERNSKSNALYIFAIYIKNKQVYIKLKIQSYDEKIILCMSFHFVEFQINKFPYK